MLVLDIIPEGRSFSYSNTIPFSDFTTSVVAMSDFRSIAILMK